MWQRIAEGFRVCDGLEAAKRQKSAQALAATTVIGLMCTHSKTVSHMSVTAGRQMTFSVMTPHHVLVNRYQP